MTVDSAVQLFGTAIFVLAKVVGPMLIASLVVGVIVGILQAATQINEASISFVVKLVAVGVTVIAIGPWAMRQLVDYTARTIGSIATIAQ